MNKPPFIQMPSAPSHDAIMDFDRSICAGGTKEFIRNSDPNESLPHPSDFIRVMEIYPGARVRTPAEDPR